MYPLNGEPLIPRLHALNRKARDSQWNVDTDIDWTQEACPAPWLPKGIVRTTVSQLYFGEIASAEMCRRLLATTVDSNVRTFLTLQITDETRHAIAYRRYLKRVGGITEASASLMSTLSAGYDAPGGLPGKLVACHLLLESEALKVHEVLADRVGCPLLNTINRRVGPDEARHVAFGKIMARDLIPKMSDQTQAELSQWSREAWHNCAQNLLDDFGGFSALALKPFKRRISEGWARQAKTLREIGLPVDA